MLADINGYNKCEQTLTDIIKCEQTLTGIIKMWAGH